MAGEGPAAKMASEQRLRKVWRTPVKSTPVPVNVCVHACVAQGVGDLAEGWVWHQLAGPLAAKGSAGGRGGCSGHECGADGEHEWRVQLASQL